MWKVDVIRLDHLNFIPLILSQSVQETKEVLKRCGADTAELEDEVSTKFRPELATDERQIQSHTFGDVLEAPSKLRRKGDTCRSSSLHL
jgi:hypothetical protein